MIEKVMTKITALFGMSQSPDKGGQRCADALSGKVGDNGDIIGIPERKLRNLLQSLRPMPDE